jgi:hypothetical protein
MAQVLEYLPGKGSGKGFTLYHHQKIYTHKHGMNEVKMHTLYGK